MTIRATNTQSAPMAAGLSFLKALAMIAKKYVIEEDSRSHEVQV